MSQDPASCSSLNPPVDDPALTKRPTEAELSELLQPLVNWQGVAVHLLPMRGAGANIQMIKAENSSVKNQKLALYTKWLAVDPLATWNKVIDALNKAEEVTLAESVATKNKSTNEKLPADSTGVNQLSTQLKSAKVTSTARPDIDAARTTTTNPVLVHAEEDDHAEKVDGDGQLPDVYYYKVNESSRRRGIAVIINNIKFAVQEERSSSVKDADDLETMFKNLRYKVIRMENLPGRSLKEDLQKKSIEEELKNVAKNEVTGDDDSFICCILSHGSADGIIGTDEKLVKIAELAKIFDAENCPNLSGKPKLFFLQACRGAGLSEPVTVDSASSGASNMPSPMEEMSVDGRTIPPEADFLFSFSTSDGTMAARSPDVNKGSPYIQELCQAITENAKRYMHVHSLVTLLTVVNFRVAGRNFKLGEKPFKVMPEYRSTLRKKVKLK